MGRWRTCHHKPERRVLIDGLPRQQSEMLEHHRDASGGPGHLYAEHPQLAGAEIDKAGDATQKGRLAAPAWSDNAENLLMADVERELAECHDGAVQEQLARQLHADRNL